MGLLEGNHWGTLGASIVLAKTILAPKYRQLRIVLSTEDNLNYLELPISAALVPVVAGQQVPLETLAAHDAWVKRQKEVVVLMLMTMEPYLQRNLETLGAYDILKELKTLFLNNQSRNCSNCQRVSRVQARRRTVCHWMRNRPKYLYELLKSKKLPQGASTSDSYLLWHCRLGHISKKRIEKLQHDGLLNSIDTKSFEKCVLCLSGKMARKLYSHQVERARDLLGLIHKELATSSPSLTTSVEVENQLGKTIKLLRFDCGEEYMSQELLDHLEEHEIIVHRTPPYIPQHNDVFERRNRTLLDMDLVDLPPKGKSIGCKWLFKKNTDIDGAVHTCKARLVAKGFTETHRIDYEETFSSIAHIRAIRILIVVAKFYEYEICIPMQDKLKLSKSQGASTPAEVKRMQNVLYASVVRFIMYAVRFTCLDVAFAQNITSRFQQNPDDDLDDGKKFNELIEYENARTLRQERIINNSDRDDLAFECMIGFRKFTAYLDPFLPMNIISRKSDNTIVVKGPEGTGKNLVFIVKDVYVIFDEKKLGSSEEVSMDDSRRTI
nr:hypothetical protein [Tanacetum cinerariifolium]